MNLYMDMLKNAIMIYKDNALQNWVKMKRDKDTNNWWLDHTVTEGGETPV